MPLVLYDFVVWCFEVILRLVSPFHQKAKKMLQGRSHWQTKLKGDFQGLENPVVWFHCASLGEFEQGRPLLESFCRVFPHYKVLLTFFSPSGYEVRKSYPHAHAVHYLPWDTASNAREFYNIVKPKVSFIIKYEFWYHFITEGKDRNVPVMVCSSIFNGGQIFFKPYGGLFRKILLNLEHIFVQDCKSLELLKKIGIDSVTVAGDTRMDRVAAITENTTDNELVKQFVNEHETFIIGSSWPQDISVIAPLVNSETHMKFIIAPHEINHNQLIQLDTLIKRSSIRYSELPGPSEVDVLIIDTIGILSYLYQYGKYAYIGGAFGKGLHNILESATFGLPLFFGDRNYQQFREAVSLVELKGAFPINDAKELYQAYKYLDQNENLYQQTSAICRNFVKENTGATKIIMDHVLTALIP